MYITNPFMVVVFIIIAFWLLSIMGMSGIFAAIALYQLFCGHLLGALIFGALAYLLHGRR